MSVTTRAAPGSPGRDGADSQQVGLALAGKYMTFRLAGEDYGLAILKVRELIGLLDITRVPGAPEFVRGVVNLRGKVIPIVDLRVKFGLSNQGESTRPVIIVVQVMSADGQLTMGILVDEVMEVRDIKAGEIEPSPAFGVRGAEVEFILGVGKTDKRVVFLLDIDRVLTTAELARLKHNDGAAHGAQP